MTQKRADRIHLIISGILILSIGLFSGYTAGFMKAKIETFPEIKIVPDTNEGVATVKFTGLKNGALEGETAGRHVRLAYNPESILELEPDTFFSIPLRDIDLREYKKMSDFPPDVLFVASKKGKYYYPVSDPQALRLSEKNRVHFQSKEEAEKQGYQSSR